VANKTNDAQTETKEVEEAPKEVEEAVTLPAVGTPWKFNSSPLKMDGWKMSFLLGFPIFRGYVKLWGGTLPKNSIASSPLKIASKPTIKL